jgi:nucleoside-diphosphate-sugar epimerase
MEFMARQFADKLNITIARPFNYTGVGQSADFLIPKIVRHFQEKLPVIELGNTDVSRDFSDVRTVVEYMARLIETPEACGSVFNICSGQAYSLQYILETCEALSGHKLTVEISPKLQRANEIKSLAGNPRHLHQIVGRAEAPDLPETLSWMLNA